MAHSTCGWQVKLCDPLLTRAAPQRLTTCAKEVMLSSLFVWLCVCLLATLRNKFGTDLREIFKVRWQ